MITPIRTMTIEQICERKDDLLIGSEDVKKLAKTERNKAIDEFAEKLKERMEDTRWTTIFDTSCIFENDKLDKCIKIVDEIAEQMKGV